MSSYVPSTIRFLALRKIYNGVRRDNSRLWAPKQAFFSLFACFSPSGTRSAIQKVLLAYFLRAISCRIQPNRAQYEVLKIYVPEFLKNCMKLRPGLPDRKRFSNGEMGWMKCRSLRVFDPDHIYQSWKSSTSACTPATRKTSTIWPSLQPPFANTGIQVFPAGEMVPTPDKNTLMMADFLKRDN